MDKIKKEIEAIQRRIASAQKQVQDMIDEIDKAKKELKTDIDFLREILSKITSYNLHDQDDGKMMLRDQISHMEKRLQKG